MQRRADMDALTACDLPQAWAGQAAWTVLDTDFQNGLRFLQVWYAWRQDPQRPHMLHYVGIADAAHDTDVHTPPVPSHPPSPLESTQTSMLEQVRSCARRSAERLPTTRIPSTAVSSRPSPQL